MRTAGQGQAAVPGERVRRRRKDGLPGRSDLGRGENISRTVTKSGALSRPLRPGPGGVRFTMECVSRAMVFVLRRSLVWGSQQMRRKYI